MDLDTVCHKKVCYVALLMAILLCGCKGTASDHLNCLIIRCHSFSVVAHNNENPQGKTIYQIDAEDGLLITSIAYYPAGQLIAVALTSKEPKKGSAIIRLLEYGNKTIDYTIATGKDRITGMDFNDNGEIVFSANHMNRNYPGELCYIPSGSNSVHVLAEGFFLNPEWDTDSKGIYFSYRNEDLRGVAYMSIDTPGSFSEIAQGSSISVSDSGMVAYLSDGKIFVADGKGQDYSQVELPKKYTDARFIDSIQFAKGSKRLILQRYKKATVYDLLETSPPYKKVETLIQGVGGIDFEVVSTKTQKQGVITKKGSALTNGWPGQ